MTTQAPKPFDFTASATLRPHIAALMQRTTVLGSFAPLFRPTTAWV